MARDGDEAEKGAAAEEKKRLKEEEEHTPKLSVWFALTLLLVVTVITGGESLVLRPARAPS